MHGQFVWYELSTPEIEAAIEFYARFTGWGTQRFDENYVMWTTGGVPFAGIFLLNDEMRSRGIPPNWMPYVEVDNVDETAGRAESLGATITAGPDEIPGTGRFAVVRDPQGAVFGIYKSFNQSNAWGGKAVVGRFSWHELMTTDHVTAAKFYEDLFGWRKLGEMDMGGGEMYHLFGQNGNMYGGIYSTPAQMAGMHPFWLVYINVRDVGKAVDIATKHGASVHRPQMDIPGGSIAILADPQGAGFALHHVGASTADTTPSIDSTPRKTVQKVTAMATKAVRKVAAKVVRVLKKTSARTRKATVKAKKQAARKPVRKTAKPVRKSKTVKPTARTRTRKAPMRKSATRSGARGGARKKK